MAEVRTPSCSRWLRVKAGNRAHLVISSSASSIRVTGAQLVQAGDQPLQHQQPVAAADHLRVHRVRQHAASVSRAM